MYNPRKNFYEYCEHELFEGDEALTLRLIWQAIEDKDYRWLESDESVLLCKIISLDADMLVDMLPYYGDKSKRSWVNDRGNIGLYDERKV